MSLPQIIDIDPILTDRVRLSIVSLLYKASDDTEVTFNDILSALELTKGNLSSHMSKLEGAEIIEIKKEFVGKKPKTTYRLTENGKQKFLQYLSIMEEFLKANKPS